MEMNKENQDPTTPQDAKNSSKPGRGKLNQSAVCKSGFLSKPGDLCASTCTWKICVNVRVKSSVRLSSIPSLHFLTYFPIMIRVPLRVQALFYLY